MDLFSFGAGAAGVGLLGALYLRRPPKADKIEKAAAEHPPNTLSEYPAGMCFKTTDGTACLPIRTGREGKSSIPSVTLHDLFRELLDNGKGKHPALRAEIPCPKFPGDPTKDPPSAPLDQWHTWTYEQYYQDSRAVAKAFLSFQLSRFASVNI